MGIESLGGGEGDNMGISGLECGSAGDGIFKFSDWEGGEVAFLGTSISQTGEKEKASNIGGLEGLQQWLMDLY
jgi:signal recognition particle receptor subunit beta